MFRRGFRRLFGPYGWLRLRNTNGPPEISREMDLDFTGDTAEAVPLLLAHGRPGHMAYGLVGVYGFININIST